MKKFFVALLLIIGLSFAGYKIWHSPKQEEFSSKSQTPTPPYPYESENIEVNTEDGKIQIRGTLTIPNGDGPHPAAVLLSVAGPNDRDQAFAGHAGFHVLADHLTRNGYAVARYDDRGVGGSNGNYFNASWNDFAKDALAVTEYLSMNDRIDRSRIGYIGMSQGGAVGALASAQRQDTAFLVLLSAPGLTGEEALRLQLEKTFSALSVKGDRAEKYRALFEEYIQIAKSDPNNSATRKAMSQFMEGPGRALIPPYAFLPKDTEGLVDILLGPWYRSNVLFNPEASYGPLDVPVLAIAGGKDFVAPADKHLPNIMSILCQTSNSHVSSQVYPNLNHLLQEAKTGLPTEYGQLETSFSEQVLDRIVSWLEEEMTTSSCP